MCSELPKKWVLWLSLAEYWYNTNFHTPAKMTPYEIVYGQPPPVHIPFLPGDSVVNIVDRSPAAREAVINKLRHNLHQVTEQDETVGKQVKV